MKPTTLRACGVLALLGLAWAGVAPATVDSASTASAFRELELHLEIDLPSPWTIDWQSADAPRSLGDLRTEVVLEATADDGLREIRMFDAAGRRVFGLASPAASLGVTELALECGAQSLAQVITAYPAGEYAVEGITLDGERVAGSVWLSHEFPSPFAVVSPLPGAALPAENATISWTPARGAVRYVLEVEQDETGFAFEITLPPDRTSFALPPVLAPGEDYEYSLLVQGDTDNELEVEGTFSTFH